MQVATLGAGTAPGAPAFARTTPSSVALQNMRTPLLLKDCGAALATNVVFVSPPAAMKPAAKNLYPPLFPELTTPSRMQAVAAAGLHPAVGPPRLARSGAKPTEGNEMLYEVSAVEIWRTVSTAEASFAATLERSRLGTAMTASTKITATT